jgi:hypothetical protein
MRVLPASAKEWFALALLPFKVFVPGGYMMVVFGTYPTRHYTYDGSTISFVITGYIVTFLFSPLARQFNVILGLAVRIYQLADS